MVENNTPAPREIADRQLVAYNAHDIDAFMALIAEGAVLADLSTGEVSVKGHNNIRDFYCARFGDNPDLHCEVHNRMDLGDFAIDYETVTGLPGGAVDIIAIYEVKNGLIQSIKFARQAKT
ncbi:nuclear transport factor 2 family protein [Kordiimonas aquimaris]|uniref:nuclear transport factor 2 family protein n=1 Tax=Kordiimonas aquimaris TaxID=707591 RepID=UPI0021CF3DBD|nr:nuclear transport factor 2 family protein [Kordiimonas aquimaris]